MFNNTIQLVGYSIVYCYTHVDIQLFFIFL